MLQFAKLSISITFIITTSVIFKLAQAQVTAEEVTWEDVKTLEHNTSVLLVDVRQPYEIEETGIIPGAINIPLNEVEATLALSEGEFLEIYNREKPQYSTPIVFYCRSGNRSTQASNLALSLGFTNVKNYKGSWLDWIQHLNQNTHA